MGEFKAIKELREDQSRIVFTADKGVAMVTMNKKGYIDKAFCLLGDSSMYRTIPKDPTNKVKNKLIGILKGIKQTGGLKDSTYFRLYPTSAVPPKFYGLSKIHKVDIPLRSIVSSRGFITYVVAKELASIIHPLVGHSPHHLKNTQHFVQQIEQVT